MDEITKARVESIVELSDALINETLKCTDRHGFNDPYLAHITLSAYTMAINRIDSVAPGFRDHMVQMLTAGNKNV